MFRLDKLEPLVKKRKRVGRGGSRGGTSGKGHKGQKARSGGSVSVGFEGGQMPLYRRLPKRGFTNARFKRDVVIVSLDQLDKKFNEGDTVTISNLVEKRIIKIKRTKKELKETGVLTKILGKGSISKKLTVHADAFSASAKQAIENAGGQAVLTTKEK